MTETLLLTSAGFENKRIGEVFIRLLNKPPTDAKVLFIPTAAISVGMLYYVGKCIQELYDVGFGEDRLVLYDLDHEMSLSQLQAYDVVYFTGGSPKHLLGKVNDAAFGPVLADFVAGGGLYVGVSAGSMLAAMLGLVNCRFTGVHCERGSPAGPIDLSICPDIKLTDRQALLVENGAAAIIE